MQLDKTNHANATGRRKYDRLEARISTEEKELLKIAAEIQGCSLTQFVVRSAQEAARKAITEHQSMSLTARDTAAFVKAIIEPPAPNDKLRQTAKRFKKIMGE